MERFFTTIRHPVRRQGAERYLLITLLSFAVSISLTRLFLSLTGYPQLGSGGFHIAHVLWGGVLLFISSLLPLLIANRWIYLLGAVLAGSGVGLFIDEVGKFITQNNDYFYPLAAPIIYGFFLLTVLLYLRIRRQPRRTDREELYRAFDAMEEVLEHDLDPEEREELEERLKFVAQESQSPNYTRLAYELLEFLTSDAITLVPERPVEWIKIQKTFERIESRRINRKNSEIFLAISLIALGCASIFWPLGFQYQTLSFILRNLIDLFQSKANIGLLIWNESALAIPLILGFLQILSGILILARKSHLGTALGSVSLLASLIGADLIIFYYDQFSTIILALLQFSVFLSCLYYRRHYLHQALPIPHLYLLM